jgi:hypothetical protein
VVLSVALPLPASRAGGSNQRKRPGETPDVTPGVTPKRKKSKPDPNQPLFTDEPLPARPGSRPPIEPIRRPQIFMLTDIPPPAPPCSSPRSSCLRPHPGHPRTCSRPPCLLCNNPMSPRPPGHPRSPRPGHPCINSTSPSPPHSPSLLPGHPRTNPGRHCPRPPGHLLYTTPGLSARTCRPYMTPRLPRRPYSWTGPLGLRPQLRSHRKYVRTLIRPHLQCHRTHLCPPLGPHLIPHLHPHLSPSTRRQHPRL